MAKRVNKSAAKTKQTAAAKRTKKTKTPVKKTPVKKTSVKKKPVKKKVTTKTTLAEAAKGAQAAIKPTTKTAKLRKNVIRLKESAPTAKFTEMGEKIKRGELKWIYYAIDGNIGYHHYEKLK